jgi:ABC-type dipeptide/oligopeptide/nickel transport system ATPase component
MADTIAVMKEGEIIEKGASDNIFEAPKNQYTKMLLNSIPNVEV